MMGSGTYLLAFKSLYMERLWCFSDKYHQSHGDSYERPCIQLIPEVFLFIRNQAVSFIVYHGEFVVIFIPSVYRFTSFATKLGKSMIPSHTKVDLFLGARVKM